MNSNKIIIGGLLSSQFISAYANDRATTTCGPDVFALVDGTDKLMLNAAQTDQANAQNCVTKNAAGGHWLALDTSIDTNSVGCRANLAAWEDCCCADLTLIDDGDAAPYDGAAYDTIRTAADACTDAQYYNIAGITVTNYSSQANGTGTCATRSAYTDDDADITQYWFTTNEVLVNNQAKTLTECKICAPKADAITAAAAEDDAADALLTLWNTCSKAATDSSFPATNQAHCEALGGDSKCQHYDINNTNLDTLFGAALTDMGEAKTICAGTDTASEVESAACIALTTEETCYAGTNCDMSNIFYHYTGRNKSKTAANDDATRYYTADSVCVTTEFGASSGSDGLSAGAIAGIVIGSIVAVGVIGVVVWYAMSK